MITIKIMIIHRKNRLRKLLLFFSLSIYWKLLAFTTHAHYNLEIRRKPNYLFIIHVNEWEWLEWKVKLGTIINKYIQWNTVRSTQNEMNNNNGHSKSTLTYTQSELYISGSNKNNNNNKQHCNERKKKNVFISKSCHHFYSFIHFNGFAVYFAVWFSFVHIFLKHLFSFFLLLLCFTRPEAKW